MEDSNRGTQTDGVHGNGVRFPTLHSILYAYIFHTHSLGIRFRIYKISMPLGGFMFTDRGDFRDYNQVRSVVHA